MSYSQQKTAAMVLAALLAGLAIIQAAPADLGLTPVMARWVGVIAAMLGVLAGFLPSVRNLGTDPQFLAHRVSELPLQKRRAFATRMANQAEKDAEARQV